MALTGSDAVTAFRCVVRVRDTRRLSLAVQHRKPTSFRAWVYGAELLKNVPDHLLTTDLLLRCPRPGDGRALFDAAQESLESLLPWLGWAATSQLVEDYELFCREGQIAFLSRTKFPYLMWSRATGELVGSCSIFRVRGASASFELGYWVRKSSQGKGLATQSVLAAYEACVHMHGARRVQIRADTKNTASQGVALRAGFKLEGVLGNDRQPGQDTCVFSRLNPER